VNAVGIQVPREFHVVIDDKGDAETPAEPFQLTPLVQTGLARLSLGPVLHHRNTAAQGCPHPLHQVVTLVGNQVDPGNGGLRRRLVDDKANDLLQSLMFCP